jgi:arabinofuranosyltransferase
VEDKTNWRIGHFRRALPTGYDETIKTGNVNALRDPVIRDYYERLHLVISGNLGDMSRLPEIWRFLTGENDRRLRAGMKAQSSSGE